MRMYQISKTEYDTLISPLNVREKNKMFATIQDDNYYLLYDDLRNEDFKKWRAALGGLEQHNVVDVELKSDDF